MDALIALGTVLGIVVAGGTIWTWVWPRIKHRLDKWKARRESTRRAFTYLIVEVERWKIQVEAELKSIRREIEGLKTSGEIDAENIASTNDRVHDLDVRLKELELEVADIATSFWSTPEQSN